MASVTVNVIVPQVATTTNIAASASSLQLSGSTQLTVTVRAAGGNAPPAGAVAFLLGGKLLGTGVLRPSAGSPAAIATFTLRGGFLSPGDNVIVSSYGGSSTFSASTASITITATPSRIKLRLE